MSYKEWEGLGPPFAVYASYPYYSMLWTFRFCIIIREWVGYEQVMNNKAESLWVMNNMGLCGVIYEQYGSMWV